MTEPKPNAPAEFKFEDLAWLFIKHSIDGPMLLRLDEDLLEDMGFESLGDRMKLNDHIEQVYSSAVNQHHDCISVLSRWKLYFSFQTVKKKVQQARNRQFSCPQLAYLCHANDRLRLG